MLDIADDGRLQVSAGLALLETSELVTWDCEAARFEPVTFSDFECEVKHFHRVFGRVICWIVFSAGAEFLAKGVCILHGTPIRKQACVPAYPPQGDIATWLKNYQPGSKTLPTTDFGQMGNLYNLHLRSLCQKVGAAQDERTRILAAYELLGKTIRNRDAHAYVPKKRASHFYLVHELFIQCLNDLIRWTQLPAGELNKWRTEAKEYIDRFDDQDSDSSICNQIARLKQSWRPKIKRVDEMLKSLGEDELDKVIAFLDKMGLEECG